MSLLRRTAYGFGWNHLGRVGEYVLLYAISIAIARSLGPELNGTYSLVLSLVHLFLILSAFGFETSLAASLSPLVSEDNQPAIRGIVRGLLLIRLAAMLLFCGGYLVLRHEISSFLNTPPFALDYLSTVLLYFLVRGIVSLLVAVLIARMETKYSAMIGICCRVLELTGVLLLLDHGFGLGEILLVLTASQFLQAILITLTIQTSLRGAADASGLRKVLLAGWKFWINMMMEFLLGRQADVLLLGFFLVGTAAIGQYDVAVSFSQLINFGMTTGLTGVSIASFSALSGQRSDLVPQYWETLVRFVTLAVVPVLVISTVFADDILPAVYGAAFADAALLFQVIACFLIVTRFLGGGIAADYLHAAGQTTVLLKSSAISGFANIVLAIVLIPIMGPMGAVISTGVAALCIAALHGFYARRFLAARLPVASSVQVLAAGIATAVVVKLFGAVLSWNSLLIVLFFSPPVFVGLCYLLKPLKDVDVDAMYRVNPLLGRLAHMFARIRFAGGVLTDRQKFAYAWMPTSDLIVDVGSSNTPLGSVLASKGKRVVVVDTDADAIGALHASDPGVLAVTGRAEHLPIPSGSVDALLLLDVLEHVGDERRVIAEVHRVLKTNGMFILSVPHAGAFSFLDPQNLRTKLDGAQTPQNIHRHYSTADLRALLEPGFQMLRRHRGGSFIYPITFWANHFFSKHLKVDWGRFFKRLGDLDNDISWGPLSYNIIIMAEKVS